jgi:RimJ/RimL family protein N-acetyltransferase
MFDRLRAPDVPFVRRMEQSVFGDQRIPCEAILAPAGAKRYGAYVLRDRNTELPIAFALLDNRKGDARYEAGWCALDSLMRDPAMQRKSSGESLLRALQYELRDTHRVGDEAVHSIYARVWNQEPKLIAWYERMGFTRVEEQVEGECVMHWKVPRKPLQCVLQ